MHGFKLIINEKIMKMKEACISFTHGRIPLILHPQDRTGARLANILDCHYSTYTDLSSHRQFFVTAFRECTFVTIFISS
jgi:hypothetical protein